MPVDHVLAHLDGATLSLLWGLPFAGLLLSIAFVPLFAPKLWHDHYGTVAALWALGLLVPFAATFGAAEALHNVVHAIVLEYIPFVAMLFALFTIAGGICLRGALAGTPAVNTGLLALGAVAGERHGDDRRGDAADPAAADRQREPAAQGARGRVLHPAGRQRGRRAVAAGGSAALHRLPEGRRLLLDRRARWRCRRCFWPSRCSPSSSRSTGRSIAGSRKAPARRPTTSRLSLEGVPNFLLLAGVIAAVLLSGVWNPGIAFDIAGAHVELQDALRSLALILLGAASLAHHPGRGARAQPVPLGADRRGGEALRRDLRHDLSRCSRSSRPAAKGRSHGIFELVGDGAGNPRQRDGVLDDGAAVGLPRQRADLPRVLQPRGRRRRRS